MYIPNKEPTNVPKASLHIGVFVVLVKLDTIFEIKVPENALNVLDNVLPYPLFIIKLFPNGNFSNLVSNASNPNNKPKLSIIPNNNHIKIQSL